MSVNRLTSIQWQFMRQTAWGCSGASVMGGFILFYIWNATGRLTLFQNGLGWTVPAFPGWSFAGTAIVILAGCAFIFGGAAGYLYGDTLKKRLDVILQSTLQLERGNLLTRIPALGEDEIGRLANQLNEMTNRFQEQVASLQRLSAHNAQLNDQVRQAAVVEERQRLARELHDAVSQQLFAISMTMAALNKTILKQPEKAARQAALVEEMAAAAQTEMRALLLHLRPAHLEGKALGQGIHDLLSELAAKHPLAFQWSIEHLPPLPKGMEDHLFRILQESLSNILRHSKAKSVDIRLLVFQNHLRLKITDDGVGFSEETNPKSSSYGMELMRERAAEIGGTLTISTAPGQGTMIEVTVPLVIT